MLASEVVDEIQSQQGKVVESGTKQRQQQSHAQ